MLKMELPPLADLYNKCRFCLQDEKEVGKLRQIEKETVTLFNDITNSALIGIRQLSKVICSSCHSNFVMFFNFKNRMLENQANLNKSFIKEIQKTRKVAEPTKEITIQAQVFVPLTDLPPVRSFTNFGIERILKPTKFTVVPSPKKSQKFTIVPNPKKLKPSELGISIHQKQDESAHAWIKTQAHSSNAVEPQQASSKEIGQQAIITIRPHQQRFVKFRNPNKANIIKKS